MICDCGVHVQGEWGDAGGYNQILSSSLDAATWHGAYLASGWKQPAKQGPGDLDAASAAIA